MKTFVGFLGAAALAAFWRPADAQTATAPPQPRPAAAAQTANPAAQATLAALQKVCMPLLEGRDIKSVATAAGLKDSDAGWISRISGKQQVTYSPPDSANPHVCSATIAYQPGSGPAILAAVRGWAKAQAPPLQPDKVGARSTDGASQFLTSSWTGQTAKGAEGLVLDEQKPSSGAPAAGGLNQANLLVSLTPS